MAFRIPEFRLKVKPGVDLREVARNKDVFAQFMTSLDAKATAYLREGFYDKDGRPVMWEQGLLEAIQPGDTPQTPFYKPGTQGVDVDRLPADTQYLQIFGTVQSTAESESYDTMATSIVFKKLLPGRRVEFGQVTGDQVTLINDTYGAGIEIAKQWLEDNKIWKIEEAITEAKIAAFDTKAQIHYSLFTGNAGFNTVAKGADNWIDVLNAAFVRLERKGILAPNQIPVVLTHGELRAQLEQAKKESSLAEKGPVLTRDFSTVYTRYVAANHKAVYITVPGRRNHVSQERLALEMAEDEDITNFSSKRAWRFRGSAMIRRTDAVEKITY
jgi:hypothetical protein